MICARIWRHQKSHPNTWAWKLGMTWRSHIIHACLKGCILATRQRTSMKICQLSMAFTVNQLAQCPQECMNSALSNRGPNQALVCKAFSSSERANFVAFVEIGSCRLTLKHQYMKFDLWLLNWHQQLYIYEEFHVRKSFDNWVSDFLNEKNNASAGRMFMSIAEWLGIKWAKTFLKFHHQEWTKAHA